MHYGTLRNIVSGAWAIAGDVAQARIPILARMLAGEQVEWPTYSTRPVFDENTGIAIIPVHGELVKYDECMTGTATMADWFRQAESNNNIHTIILDIDSPGGMVDGTLELVETIRRSEKETIAYINGMAASAAYWIAAAADRIYARTEFSEVGSVGVMLSIADIRPKLEKEGVRFHEVYASQSTEKNKLFRELLDGKYDNVRREMLDPLAEKFVSDIRAFRPKIEDDQLTGKMFYARDVIGSMIDGIRDLDTIVSASIQLTPNTYTMAKEELEQTQEKVSLATKILSALGLVDEAKKVEETADAVLSAKQVEELQANYSAAAEELEKVKAENEQLTAKINALSQELEQAKAKIEELEALPGAEEAQTAPETDGNKKEGDIISEDMPFAEKYAKLSSIWNTKNN